jgi:5-deoxy-5-amino-3-dehydroquinate synthase
VVLVGLMGVGKTSVGRLLARDTKRAFADTDHLVEAQVGTSIADIFATEGEPAFRVYETEALNTALESSKPTVIATGGGVVETPAARDLLRRARAAGHRVIWLRASVATMRSRTGRSQHRPLLAAVSEAEREATLRGLLERRSPLYAEVADLEVSTDSATIPRIVRTIMGSLDTPPSAGGGGGGGRRRVRVELGDRSYDVVVGAGAVTEVASLLPSSAKRAVIVSQVGVPSLPELPLPTQLIHIPDGEDHKTLSTVEALCREFARFGLTRNDVVIAVGGGLVTDVAGFAAASYHRGTAVVHVATTLLAMVDAAIGGKTGVNLPEGKNLVGAFWQPSGVVCDTNHLDTLPERELRCGWGEVAKYHFLTGDDLMAMDVDERVARCAQIKADIVSEDEREGGRRALLNYGHTFAHAIETESGHRFAHGEAVAIGMICAAHLARLMGRIDEARVAQHYVVLEAYGLMSQLPADLDPDALLRVMGRDKKATSGLTFILDGPTGLETIVGVEPRLVLESLALASSSSSPSSS